MKNLGNIFRLITAIGLVSVLFMAIYAKPALAEDGSPDGMTKERPTHPCSVAANLRLQSESEKEICDGLGDAVIDAIHNTDEIANRWLDLIDQITALQDEIINEFGDHPSWPVDVNPNSFWEFLSQMEGFLEYYNDCGYTYDGWDIELAAQLEEKLNELRSLVVERDAVVSDYESARSMEARALDRYGACDFALKSTERSYYRARDDCNLTRCYFRSLRDGQPADLMSIHEGPMLHEMGSDADQASNAAHRAILFNDLKKNLPRAQIMQAHQRGSTNKGTNAAGDTHMSSPLNTGRSKPAVRTAATPKSNGTH